MPYTPNKCDKCPITAITPCSLQAFMYEHFGYEGLSKCEVRQDVEKMIEGMRDLAKTWEKL